MAINGRNLQILANYCAAAADAMAFTLMRTAHSTFVKETEDFSCQIVSRDGMAFASPRSFGAPWYSGIDYGPVLALIDSYQEGDICITNDSYAGNVATHSPDIHIWKPVFHNGAIVCFVVGHIHNTDVGGAVPASLSRSLTDIVQEGIRIPPLKIVRNGELNEEVASIMRLNVRVPEQNWGDFKAQIASVNVGERKIHDIIARFGVEDFLQGIEGILDYAEAQARSIIATIPDGEYFYADFADEDGEGGYPCRVAITLRISGDTLELDYTGSDPQLASSLNMPTGGRERHPLALVGVTYVLSTLDRHLLLNAGTLRPTRAILPPGTVMNCEAPAAVGMRSLTCALSQIATIGVFSQALPDRLPANSPGGNSIMNIRTSDSQNRSVVASLGPVGGGAGGTPRHDGPDGSGGLSAFLKNTPIEINEAEVPIHFHRYGLAADSAGAGRYRGGLATEMAFEITAPNTTVTARNRNRSVFASAGVLGGESGALSHFRTLRNGKAIEHGNTDVIRCQPGDIVEVRGPGAGGYGLPVERDTAAVLQDVRCGFVSRQMAREHYGVAIIDDEVDAVTTARLRAEMQHEARQHFDHGPARTAFEQQWTPARYALLTTFLAQAPVSWRHFLKQQVFDAVAVEAQPATREAVAADPQPAMLEAQMQAIFQKLQQRYPAMMNRSH
ncbi:hydantoinase B/oxoprolinase family protein [Pantoea sp. S61]|uniref:hydantoinase B/oxoprolinase family protein n=1 Tax=Pantoea sp. S61 TaxID=2767442 RepID=UPI00190B06AA|nr:hydantoinase B/oxoprolinase family protein [Pantoea sp. S61]MBK0124805.1 hydantoinase B/oxoprolinase family protein [Pantoea sp. S61]